MTRPTLLGRLIALAIAAAAVMAALSVLLPAVDAHQQLNDTRRTRPQHHRLPDKCWSAHEVFRDGQVRQLCDLFRPTPEPAPSPSPQARAT